MKIHLYLAFITTFSTGRFFCQEIVITEKPLMIEDTVLSSLSNISEIDVKTQFAYGVVKIDDAGFFELFGTPSTNNLFLYNKKHTGKLKTISQKTGAIAWNCWFGTVNPSKITALLELNTKNETDPGEIVLFAVNYSIDGSGSTYLYFDLLPDISANSSFPDFEENPYIRSSIGAVNSIALSEKPKNVSANIKIEYINNKGELKTIKQPIVFKNLHSDFLFESRYPSKNTRNLKHYVNTEISSAYLETNFDENKAEITRSKAISLFEDSQAGAQIKFISYAQTYEKWNDLKTEIKSKAVRCHVVYTQDNKCFFGDVYFRKFNVGNEEYSESEIERFELEGEVECSAIE